jgi:hypothetical protein
MLDAIPSWSADLHPEPPPVELVAGVQEAGFGRFGHTRARVDQVVPSHTRTLPLA